MQYQEARKLANAFDEAGMTALTMQNHMTPFTGTHYVELPIEAPWKVARRAAAQAEWEADAEADYWQEYCERTNWRPWTSADVPR